MNKKAFTLLEILLVVALISIVLIVLIRLINPEKQVSDINNAQRKADILNIYTAINQYRDNNSGQLPIGITTQSKKICKPGCTINTDKVDISSALEPYITFGKIPIDPQQNDTDTTGYEVYISPEGRVVVSASLAERDIIIDTKE